MSDKFGWCIIGTGAIARNVAKDSENIHIVSAYNRSIEKSQKFCQEYGGVPYLTLEQAVTASGVDGVYVATTNDAHLGNVISALKLGKPVLCEKPMGLHAGQTREMAAVAKAKGLFLAEAMWVRYNPIIKTIMDWVKAKEIGEVHYFTANFTFSVDHDPESRFYNRALGGGSLLDMGIYPIAFAQMIFGEKPIKIDSTVKALGGVDIRVSALLHYSDGKTASIYSGLDTHSAGTASIHGSSGVITIPKYWCARSAVLERKNGERLEISRDGCKGYCYQTTAVEAMIKAGLTGSPVMPLDESILIADIIDQILGQAGLDYK